MCSGLSEGFANLGFLAWRARFGITLAHRLGCTQQSHCLLVLAEFGEHGGVILCDGDQAAGVVDA